MGTILAQAVVKKASIILRDEAGRRWKPSELLGWLNDGQREIGIVLPKAVTVTQSIVMVAGSKQTIPEDCTALIDIVRNMGADGATPGAPITIAERENFDQVAPDWHTANPANDVIHYIFDGRVPRTWYCYPPQTGAGRYVEAAVQKNPVDCYIAGVESGITSTVISIDDIYQTALIEYVCHRAYLKNDETRDAAVAAGFYDQFMRRLGLKVQVDAAANPNRNAPPAQQSRKPGGANPRARAD
jgi:hypothetical protein